MTATQHVTASTIDLVAGEPPQLVVSGEGTAPVELELVGSRLRLPALIAVDGERWTATIPLLSSRWGGPALPPPSGRYRIGVAARGIVLPEAAFLRGLFRVAFEADDSGVVAEFSAPLADDEVGPENQARLEREYHAANPEPQNAVFFESFYGQNASCNPLAIARALAETRPDIARYWGVADASVDVPLGGIAVIEGSREWWRIRAAARLIVINDWLRGRYRKRSHQKVLQTWHGTMLKRLALSRRRLGLRPALATLKERARWSILLAQNSYAANIFRRSYAWLGPVWEEGYPRDDILVTGDAAAVRAKLGIADDVRVLLYAPTWRDDRPDHVDHLDVASFAEQLGDGYVTLIRGHSRTLRPGEDVRGGGVVDVTSYPDIAELFLVADALITDYSSVMFDFSVTRKPIFFFTPDLDRYREVLRGFYFDLLAVAPGPVVRDSAELLELVRNPDAVAEEYRERYQAWRERFNPRDDGQAAQRVVDRILRDGLLD
ncbi:MULTISPECIES: CDP-glycerol glycerophosphotransferase family protein [unclassified Cryobacterium]|uniref:CDP-glycerol glycerophosphotransferase family protein n=1 Tax=unclassified Cryobacterium TaxID=2649013 RepID=UPI00144742E7|nr:MULTISPECIES: CDP-glycerol glycerophosphotransferase family protein [unclassified Cryobacterium]